MFRVCVVSAGHQLPSPACFAVSPTNPLAITVTVLPDTVASEVLLLSKVTARPELDSANNWNGVLSGVLSPRGWKTTS